MKKYAKYIIIGALGGAINGIFGAGAGMVLVPLLSEWAKIDYKNALATSVSVVLPISLTSAAVYIFRGGVDMPAVLPYLLGGLLGGIIGGIYFNRVSSKWIRRVFALFIIYGGVKNLL